MKNRLIKIAVINLFLFAGIIYAGAILTTGLSARSDNGNVILNWQTGQETNVRYFIIERAPYKGAYVEIAYISPKGSYSSYEYVDQNVYKTNDQVYEYRLKIVDNNGDISNSNISTVAHSASGIKQTWGSIKALFR